MTAPQPKTKLKPDGQKWWVVPKLWPGQTCYVLGGGPGLSLVDVDRLRGERVIAVNMAFALGDWIPCMFFGDCRLYHTIKKQLQTFAGLKVTTCNQHLDKPGIQVVKRKNGSYGISADPGQLMWNLSSGACAIGLGAHFGVKRIVLCGFDMQNVNGHSNYHDLYGQAKNKNPYPRFLRVFENIAKDLKARKIECVNATPGSALSHFPIVDIESVMP